MNHIQSFYAFIRVIICLAILFLQNIVLIFRNPLWTGSYYDKVYIVICPWFNFHYQYTEGMLQNFLKILKICFLNTTFRVIYVAFLNLLLHY